MGGKAIILNADRRHELVDTSEPALAPDEVLVRSRFCGICGTDLHAPELTDFCRSGVVSGHEFAGEIVAVRPDVRGWVVGQRVTANPNGHVCHQCRYWREGR